MVADTTGLSSLISGSSAVSSSARSSEMSCDGVVFIDEIIFSTESISKQSVSSFEASLLDGFCQVSVALKGMFFEVCSWFSGGEIQCCLVCL